MVRTTRRQFAGIVLGSALLQATDRLADAGSQTGADVSNGDVCCFSASISARCGSTALGAARPPYVQANTDWLAKCRFGIGVHWTAQTVSRSGPPKAFQKAVADFDLKGCIAAVEHAGADYVLFTAAHALQMLTYNAGINQTFLYTTHQDYWAGESVNLDHPVKSRYLDSGLQWFGWTCLEDRGWVHMKRDTLIRPPLYTDDQVLRYVRACNQHMAPMTFNVGIYQDGTLAS